jgi:hypothetical protein
MRIPSGKTDQLIYFVAVDSTDLKTRETGLSSFTVYRSRNGGAATIYTTPTVAELSAGNMPGVYSLAIDEDTTIAAGSDSEEYCVHITQASMAPVTRTIELYRRDTTSGQTATVANGAIDADVERIQGTVVSTPATAGILDVNVKNIDNDAASASGTVTFPNATLASTTNITAGTIATVTTLTNLPAITANWLTANGINADAITAAKVAADVTTEIWAGSTAPSAATIAAAVWDLDATAHQTQGTFGQAIGDPAADTNTIFKAVVTDATGATVGVDVVAIKAETVEILADTDDIGVAGAGLTNIGTIATVTTLTNLPTIPANWLTAAGTAADFTTEIQAGLATAANLATVAGYLDTEIATLIATTDAILVDTGTTLEAALAVVDANVDAILVDTGTTLDGNITAIKAKTDSLTFTVAAMVDANIQAVNDITVTGNGSPGTEWGP